MSTSPTYPLRIGVLGCANIARQFIRDVEPSKAVRVVAVASRNAQTAQTFAAEQGVARFHGSYEALLSDAEVDAIYLPLPNSLHAEWAMAAARSGKHVLCEKPLALSVADARAMFAEAKNHGVMLLEGYPWWFQPQTQALQALLQGGAIGCVRGVQASFGFSLGNQQTNIRMKPELGGGALLDAGSYPLSLIRLVMGEAPERVMAQANWSESGVDISLTATLSFANGRSAQLSCAMDTAYHRRATIMGSQGTIETEYLNHTGNGSSKQHGYLPSELRVRRGTGNTVPFESVAAATGSGFRFCAEAFAHALARQDDAAFDRAAQASQDIAATLEAILKSARKGRAVSLA
ncbi:Gfo/Idh/MocA family oxidoreductase [Hydrogenophaga sp. PAMC20947]|uniref:Gfo/Idh/MocA family protein n=1 Tax=Hydrogenophaga sp. PAMC20947 TaxID=2565558 RepID=UPI00109D8FDD|nr:Gfo/Idh/MocA family oxidoreductase [Hydrogenophaga sp. PAMC20947]QCB46094.1 Gfo/Idh/MocA family oxidoreductase [Hydrogenophaga sp. PAMC20947]